MKTFSYNAACFKLDCLFGSRITDIKSHGTITEFFIGTDRLAVYNEATGKLMIHPKYKV